MITNAIFWFTVALILAALEIEIEGKFGWAENLPTWYRKNRLFSLIVQKKPLSGYHLFMFSLLLLFIHACFFLFTEWSFIRELQVLATWFAVIPVWDFLWFVLNPHYTIHNFKKNKIWWFSKNYWVFNLCPFEHLGAWIISIILAYMSGIFIGHIITLFILLDLTLFVTIISPLYHKWYRHMRKKDDRDKVEIFH